MRNSNLHIRRSVSIILAFVMVISISGCSSKETTSASEEIKPVEVTREAEPESLQTANRATAIALKQYIHARLVTETYMSLDPSSLTMEEIAQMADKALLAWENAEALSTSAEEIANRAVKVLEVASIEKESNRIMAGYKSSRTVPAAFLMFVYFQSAAQFFLLPNTTIIIIAEMIPRIPPNINGAFEPKLIHNNPAIIEDSRSPIP